VPDTGGLQIVQAVAHAARSRQLAAVRRGQQPAVAGDREGAVEVPCESAAFVVGEPEPHDAAVPEADGEPRERTRVEGVLHPVRRDQQPHAETGVPCRALHRVQDDLQRRDQTAQPGRVGRGVHLDLQPARTIAHVLLRGLANQSPDVLRFPQTGACDVVQPLEAEPAPLIRRPQLGGLAAAQRRRQVHAVLVGELQQRGRTHRTREVQMQMGLGQGAQISDSHSQILPQTSRPPVATVP
jgi:hypothetical protein